MGPFQKNFGVHVVDVIEDPALKAKEEAATAAFQRFFPDALPVKLYRTSGGKVGLQVSVNPNAPKFDDARIAVLRAIKEMDIVLNRVINSQQYHPCPKYLEGINALLAQLPKDSKLSLEELSECLNQNFALFIAVQAVDEHFNPWQSVPEDYLGMATIFFQKNLSGWIGEIHDVVVDKNHRGRGIGKRLVRKLLETAEEFARKHRQDVKLYLTSRPERTSANRLYRKLGFHLVACANGKSGTNLYKMVVLAEPEPMVGRPF